MLDKPMAPHSEPTTSEDTAPASTASPKVDPQSKGEESVLADGQVANDLLDTALDTARRSTALWWDRSQTSAKEPWLLAIPDVSPSCEVLLADLLFHDLSDEERSGLLKWVRSQQHSDGHWADGFGCPSLDATAFAWWALRAHGEDPESRAMTSALRAVHALGGGQRGSFMLRLWLAMAGTIDWNWLPALPSELLLAPSQLPLSLDRLSPWARGIVMPFHALSRAPARLHTPDPSPLLLKAAGRDPEPPRLTKSGLAGDLLQVFDRTVKLSRKLPRGPLGSMADRRRNRWLDEAQQQHGGWFSTRPTLLSLLALRASGATSDDPRIRRGLAYLRRARAFVEVDEGRVLVQGLGHRPIGITARLAMAIGKDDPHWLLADELVARGPWSRRADVEVGGWPNEAGSGRNVDLWSTCAALDYLAGLGRAEGPLSAQIWSARRRGGEVLMAMQESDGGFARFERGETQVPHAKLPWAEAELLAVHQPGAEARVELSAHALTSLSRLGWHGEDDRIRRGIAFIHDRFEADGRGWSTAALARVCESASLHTPESHGLRRGAEALLRGRQREDGSFGNTVETAVGLRALVQSNRSGGADRKPCVQSQRAAEQLAKSARLTSVLEGSSARIPGLGICPVQRDPSASLRESVIALSAFQNANTRR